MITKQQELQAVLNPLSLVEPDDSSILVVISAYCPGNAGSVLGRAIEAFSLVLEQSLKDWPPLQQWSSILPDWLLRQFASEPIEAEAAEPRRKWEKLSDRLRLRWWRAERDQWTLSGWIPWFEPNDTDRNWRWWSARIVNDHLFQVTLEVDDMGHPHECLDWLLRASGAVDVFEE